MLNHNSFLSPVCAQCVTESISSPPGSLRSIFLVARLVGVQPNGLHSGTYIHGGEIEVCLMGLEHLFTFILFKC